MKKMIVLFAALTICGATMAQVSSGDWIVKGGIGLNTAGTFPYDGGMSGVKMSDSYNLAAFVPRFEYFTTDRLSVGMSAGVVNAWQKGKVKYEASTFVPASDRVVYKDGVLGWFVGPNVNYYLPLANRFYLSFNGFIGYVGFSSWSVYKMGDTTEKGSMKANFGVLSVVPTLNYFINDCWMLTLSAGNASLALGGAEGGNPMYYAGVDWGLPMLGVGFKF